MPDSQKPENRTATERSPRFDENRSYPEISYQTMGGPIVSWLNVYWIEASLIGILISWPLLLGGLSWAFNAPLGWDEVRAEMFHENPTLGIRHALLSMWSPTNLIYIITLITVLTLPFFNFLLQAGAGLSLLCVHLGGLAAIVATFQYDPTLRLNAFPLTGSLIASLSLGASLQLPANARRVVSLLICMATLVICILPLDGWMPMTSVAGMLIGFLISGILSWNRLPRRRTKAGLVTALIGVAIAGGIVAMPAKLDHASDRQTFLTQQRGWKDSLTQTNLELAAGQIDISTYRTRIERAILSRIGNAISETDDLATRFPVEKDQNYLKEKKSRLLAIRSTMEAALITEGIRSKLKAAHRLTQAVQLDETSVEVMLDRFWFTDLASLREALIHLDTFGDRPATEPFWLQMRQVRTSFANDIDALIATGVELEVSSTLAWIRELRQSTARARTLASSDKDLRDQAQAKAEKRIKRLESIREKQSIASPRLVRLMNQLASLRDSVHGS